MSLEEPRLREACWRQRPAVAAWEHARLCYHGYRIMFLMPNARLPFLTLNWFVQNVPCSQRRRGGGACGSGGGGGGRVREGYGADGGGGSGGGE